MAYLRKLHGELLTFVKNNAEHVALTSLDEIDIEGFPRQRVVIVSCLAPHNPHNFIFGDYICFDQKNVGPYKYENIEKIKEFLKSQEKIFIFLYPQRHPVSEIWRQHKDFYYIEIPEFYGVYWDFYKYHQPDDDIYLWDTSKVVKHYMCLNKRITQPRFLWFHDLFQKNLVDKGYVSFLCEGQRQQYPDPALYENLYQQLVDDYPWLQDLKDPVQKLLPVHSSERLKIADSHCGSGGWITDSELFAQSFVNLISETHTDVAGTPIFTEKIFKTIYHRRPFFLLGSPNSLSELRALGFKTFDQWFDESYDHGNNANRRALLIVDQVQKLCNLSVHEIQNMLAEMKPVLEHNYFRLKELSLELDHRVDQIDRWIIEKVNIIKN